MDRQRPRRTDGPSVAFVGAGRAGRALALGLAAAGHRVIAVDSRSPASAEALASLRAPIFEEKVVDYILELAEVTEKAVSKDDLLKDNEEEEAA